MRYLFIAALVAFALLLLIPWIVARWSEAVGVNAQGRPMNAPAGKLCIDCNHITPGHNAERCEWCKMPFVRSKQ